ncbi:hypothetical protein CC2G_010175 [Coprinopsis cinerea AmutBmut pab1-1]|nr:hypothetical protein CC2G_010175 [Coprinopsis cinerea AmutBmut pab1-1]
MPVAVAGNNGITYACRCLNVRIRTTTTETAPPESVDDPAYAQVYVGEGIEIKHPQLTLRSRKRVATVAEGNRYSRFTTLKCLLCNIPVYRIFQIVPADVEGKDGPILPAEDYVEKEVMKSPNGWVQVNKDLLTGDAIPQAETDAAFSSLFSLVVPPLPPTPPAPASRNRSLSPRSRSPSPAPAEPPSYFAHVKKVLPPPPFTPSHPAFLHLAQLAEQDSQLRRRAAEEYVAEIIRRKTVEIEQGDATIRKQVEAVWRRYRESMKDVHDEVPHLPRVARRSSRSRERRPGRSVSPTHGSLVIRDFVPVSVPARLATSPPPRTSALSASLVTSTFHHPRAQRDTSLPRRSGSPGTESPKASSTDSSTLVQEPTTDGSINVLQFRRNINDDINTQASYRYFVNLEEDMARAKKQREEAARQAEASKPRQESGATQSTSAAGTSSATQENPTSSSNAPAQATTSTDEKAADSDPPRGRQGKGKRKVTFDVEPDVHTIRKEAETEEEDLETEEQDDAQEMLFGPMEDMEGDDKRPQQPAPALPLLEQPTNSRPARLSKARPQVMPEELASLRPSSLPAPSHIRPIRSPPGVDSSSTRGLMLSLPHQSNPLAGRRPPRMNGSKATLSPPKDAANQRGAWSADGRHWQSFTRGHTVEPTSIPEENETETGDTTEAGIDVSTSSRKPASSATSIKGKTNGQGSVPERDFFDSHHYVGVPGSAPIQIHMKTTTKPPLSLASYQPQSAIAQQHQEEQEATPTANGKQNTSSTAIRKAVYAERDRERSMDPGLMDFRTYEEEEDTTSSDEDEEDARIEAYLSTTRGRRRALKILQARSVLPDSGMWRSLAS